MSTQTQTDKSKTKKAIPPTKVSTAVVPKKATSVQASGISKEMLSADAWGAPTLRGRDIVIPKILAMQPMSKPVTAGEAKFGEFRDSLNGTILGDIKNPIEFIPFYSEKVFVVMMEEKGAFKFKTQVPITHENEDHPFECENEEGKAEKWFRTLNFYVLLPKEVEDGSAIPYLLSFRSSSARAGQKLMTTMYMKNIKAGKTPASMIMELSASKTSNDKGTYVVMDVREKRASSDVEVTEAFGWVKTIKAGGAKVDHSDLAEAATTTSDEVAVEPESGEY